jgi:UrcA family protein
MSSASLKVTAALAACLAVAGVANAQTDAPTVRVRYSDLNLSTQQGSQALYSRIVAAAAQVCQVDDIRNLEAVAAARSCRAQAIAAAVHEVGSPALAARYASEVRHG